MGGSVGRATAAGGAAHVAASALAGHEPPPTPIPALPASVGPLPPPVADGPDELPDLLGSALTPAAELPAPELPELHALERIARDSATDDRNHMTEA